MPISPRSRQGNLSCTDVAASVNDADKEPLTAGATMFGGQGSGESRELLRPMELERRRKGGR